MGWGETYSKREGFQGSCVPRCCGNSPILVEPGERAGTSTCGQDGKWIGRGSMVTVVVVILMMTVFLTVCTQRSVGYHYAVYSVCTSSSHLGRVGVQFVKLLHQWRLKRIYRERIIARMCMQHDASAGKNGIDPSCPTNLHCITCVLFCVSYC